jgi:hypothetical protein
MTTVIISGPNIAPCRNINKTKSAQFETKGQKLHIINENCCAPAPKNQVVFQAMNHYPQKKFLYFLLITIAASSDYYKHKLFTQLHICTRHNQWKIVRHNSITAKSVGSLEEYTSNK